MKWRISFGLAALVVLSFLASTPRSHAGKNDPLKQRLFERYDKKNLNVAHSNILVALLQAGTGFSGRGGNRLEYSVNYDHFDSHFTDRPKKYQGRNLLDENTTEEVEAGARFTDALAPGEMVQVRLFYVETLGHDVLRIDFYLVPLAGKRTASTQNIYGGVAGVDWKVDWGCHFRFLIPPRSPGVSDDDYFGYITEQIGHYFLPTEEYLQTTKAAAEAAKNVRIEPGMSEKDVIGALGEPVKRIQFGKKTILKYPDITVEFEDNKVVEVKAN